MTRTYALKRLLEHGALSSSEMIAITGWTRKQVWATMKQLTITGILRKYPNLKWGLIDLKPYPTQEQT
jgi:hypothetical protein